MTNDSIGSCGSACRAFLQRFALATALLLPFACGGGNSGDPPSSPTASPTPSPTPAWPPPPSFETSLDKAKGIATELGFMAIHAGDQAHWNVYDGDMPLERESLYDGTAGVVMFLAKLQKEAPDPGRSDLLQQAGAWLVNQPTTLFSQGIYAGLAGRGMAFLALHDALGDSTWLDAALQIGSSIKDKTGGPPSDLFEGPSGRGVFFLELFHATGNTVWLNSARARGDEVLAAAVPSGNGLKIPYGTMEGVTGTVFYVGLSHGSAGAGYFLCRLATALGDPAGATYLACAQGIARWLDGLKQVSQGTANWYRREPDQTTMIQSTWCHGAPGIGHFYLALWKAGGDPTHLATTMECGETVWQNREIDGYNGFTCLCHGRGGNTELLLSLYRATGDQTWLDRAQDAGTRVWIQRWQSPAWPAWTAGDGSNQNNPGLMTGLAGDGMLFLQLSAPGRIPMPITDGDGGQP